VGVEHRASHAGRTADNDQGDNGNWQ